MNHYENIAVISKRLMLKEPFYGLLLIGLNKHLDKSIPTACVSLKGINIDLHVNPTYWESKSESTRLGILKHELLHVAFFHLTNRERYSNHKLHNIAADLEINQYIDDSMKGEDWEGLEYDQGMFTKFNFLPKQGTDYYYKLLEQSEDDEDLQNLMNSMGDEHSLWGEWDDLDDATKKLIKKQVDHQIKSTAEEIKKSRGNIPGELKSYIDELFKAPEAPVIDWKSYIRRFGSISSKVLTKKSRYKQNRRFPELPTALKFKLKKKTLVAIDTSGSVSDKELHEFFGEIYHMYKTGSEVDVIECDTTIQRVYEYKGDLKKIEVKGRGGTSFEPVFRYIKENRHRYNNIIYFTDGEAPAPKTTLNMPTLWVFSKQSSFNNELPGQKIQIK